MTSDFWGGKAQVKKITEGLSAFHSGELVPGAGTEFVWQIHSEAQNHSPDIGGLLLQKSLHIFVVVAAVKVLWAEDIGL